MSIWFLLGVLVAINLGILVTGAAVLGSGVVEATTHVASNVVHSTASPISSPREQKREEQHPCAKLSDDLLAKRKKTSNSKHGLPAALAYACLLSTPLDHPASQTAAQLDGLSFLLQFQSTLAYLKNPSSSYHYPSIDLLAQIDNLTRSLATKSYKGSSEYDFQFELRKVLTRARDGHLGYAVDIVEVFTFERAWEIVSVSMKENDVPGIYSLLELDALVAAASDQTRAGSKYTPSPIVTVDGQDVEDYLDGLADVIGTAQDRDANYNALFWRSSGAAATAGVGVVGGFKSSIFYPGPQTTFGFVNGTTLVLQNVAKVQGNDEKKFEGMSDGKSFLDRLFDVGAGAGGTTIKTSGNIIKVIAGSAAAVTPVQTIAPFEPLPTPNSVVYPHCPTYPTPEIAHSRNTISGYFLSDPSDVAVLSVFSFSPPQDTQFEFANVGRRFLATAQAAGKEKLIIDLRGNGGGSVVLAIDLFKMLFPDIEPFAGFNIRASELTNHMGKVISEYWKRVNENSANYSAFRASGQELFDQHSPWNYQEHVDVNGSDCASWEEFFGPERLHGDEFTRTARYNYSSAFFAELTPLDGYDNGVHSMAHSTRQVFLPENVVLLQDGMCASACAIFSEAIKSDVGAGAGVRSVVMGGRPSFGAMAGVGASKGAMVLTLAQLKMFIEFAIKRAPKDSASRWTQGVVSKLEKVKHTLKRMARGHEGGINVKNAVRKVRGAKEREEDEEEEGTMPLQFVRDVADCRLFYRPAMLQNQSLVWAAVAEAAWRDQSKCVKGSTEHS